MFTHATPITTFTLFADVDGMADYDEGEALPLYRIGSGYQLSKFCGVMVSGAQSCNMGGTGGGSTLSSLIIYFRRPNLDASFSSTCGGSCSEVYSHVYVTLKANATTDFRAVKVTNTGQITVCQLNTEPPAC